MTVFHKAVSLAAIVASVAVALPTRAADPVIPGAPPQARPDPVAQQQEVIQLFQDDIRVQLQMQPPPLSIRDFTDESLQSILPVVGGGFASDRPVRGPLTPLVASLRSESYQERQSASQRLMHLPPDRLSDLIAALAIETDPEAITRLKVVAGHLFLKPRTNVKGRTAFLGIGGDGPYVSMLGLKFDNPEMHRLPGSGDDAVIVRITELQPGFPAAQDLRAGDCIVAIAGKPFPDEMVPAEISLDGIVDDSFMITSTNRQRQEQAKTMFQSRVRALWPGSVVAFTILRDGKILDIPVQVTAMPAAMRDTLSSLVDIRNQLLTSYVESLSTGDHPQSVSAAPAVSKEQGQAHAQVNRQWIQVSPDEFRIYTIPAAPK